ncbi:chorion protein [Danaus plexippus plexippus]|uniref:Chorion protein n=1 Tax=Danaus plexippus plexippus TaxID=278856 RepID=A0A212F8D6_DANPL|nr:chorion class A protein Ld5-like [Danaus plexippus plexippus]XP_032525289.1 chorion class A protein Ld5-like [Danaus plexippus plexippus]OWR49991.1 chorion protein [Danaus plexippus plexippus]
MFVPFAFLFVCIQACLVQDVYSQCLNRAALGTPLGQGFVSGVGLGSCASETYGSLGLNSQVDLVEEQGASYGGTGVGELYVNGLLPVEGYSSISGQVPVLGVVRFDGPVAARGSNAYSTCIGAGLSGFAPRYGPLGFTPDMSPVVDPTSYSQAYGGEGLGDISIVGKMPVSGITAVKGQVPILGTVNFGGDVNAAGTVTITGSSGYRAYRGYRDYC